MKWPIPPVNLKCMHKNGIQNPAMCCKTYHPEFSGLAGTLKNLRAESSELVYSTAKIPLPFAVQTYIYEKHKSRVA